MRIFIVHNHQGNENQTSIEICHYMKGILREKQQMLIRFWLLEKENSSKASIEMEISASSIGISMKASSRK